jgi:hypothetical protein
MNNTLLRTLLLAALIIAIIAPPAVQLYPLLAEAAGHISAVVLEVLPHLAHVAEIVIAVLEVAKFIRSKLK